jgi:hypothetical protein
VKRTSKENIIYILLIFVIAPAVCYSILFSNIVIKNTIKPVIFFGIYYVAAIVYSLLCMLLNNINYKDYIKEQIRVLSLSQPRNSIVYFLIIFEVEVTYKNHVQVNFKFDDKDRSIVLNNRDIKYDLEKNQEPYIELLYSKRRMDFKNPILHYNKKLVVLDVV